jgi:hypothetical protein
MSAVISATCVFFQRGNFFISANSLTVFTSSALVSFEPPDAQDA